MEPVLRRWAKSLPAPLRIVQRRVPRRMVHASRTISRLTSTRSQQILAHHRRAFTTRTALFAPAGEHVSEPANLTPAEYHTYSDSYIDSLVEVLEEMAESREAMDVEYHSGVLNLVFPPAGTYVINKQPPNRQIWLSSPISGPKRYDYVLNGAGKGDWVYLRDGSLLTDLLNEELKLNWTPPDY